MNQIEQSKRTEQLETRAALNADALEMRLGALKQRIEQLEAAVLEQHDRIGRLGAAK